MCIPEIRDQLLKRHVEQSVRIQVLGYIAVMNSPGAAHRGVKIRIENQPSQLYLMNQL